jgi:hypothetical protein
MPFLLATGAREDPSAPMSHRQTPRGAKESLITPVQLFIGWDEAEIAEP